MRKRFRTNLTSLCKSDTFFLMEADRHRHRHRTSDRFLPSNKIAQERSHPPGQPEIRGRTKLKSSSVLRPSKANGRNYRTNTQNHQTSQQKLSHNTRMHPRFCRTPLKAIDICKVKHQTSILNRSRFSIGGHKDRANQDRVVCRDNFFIVCDGHGPEGGHVSAFVSQRLSSYILKHEAPCIDEETLLVRAFDQTDQQLQNCSDIDTLISGSTALVVYICDGYLYCANAGDCRAIMSKRGDVVSLSNQHRPAQTKERQRIVRLGGLIQKSTNGPYRLYNPKRKYGVGGLAVSRSFGDSALKDWGLTHEPEVLKFEIDSRSDFVILGSDGFFQFFTVSQVVSHTYRLLERGSTNLAQELVMQASRRWQGFDETDDISCIIVLF